MEPKDVIAALGWLERMDSDAVRVYEHAIEKAQDPVVVRNLQRFQQDHRRHVEDIRRLAQRHGWTPMGSTAEFEQLMQGLADNMDRARGEDQTMLALELTERATNAEYADALELDVDDQTRELLQRAFHDEQHHLQFAESHMPAGVGAGARSQVRPARREGRHGGWGTGGYGTGDQFGGGESGEPESSPGGLGGYGSESGRPPGGYYESGEEAATWGSKPGGTGRRRY